MPTKAPRVPGLDTLRSLAILSVIGYHLMAFHGQNTLPGFLLPAARIGWMGVDLFFVLSGYLIASQLLKPYLAGAQPSLWTFYRNRFFRVLPVYLVVLLLYYVLPVWPENHALAPLWQYLTFTFNLFLDLNRSRAFTHVWSLCVEEHFYLFLPLVVLLAMRKPSARKAALLLIGLVLLGIAIRGYFLFHLLRPLQEDDNFGIAFMERIYYPTYSRLDGLLAGVTLALIKTFRPAWWAWLTRRGYSLLALGAALLGVAIWIFNDQFPAFTGTSIVSVLFGFPLSAAGLACLVLCALSKNGLLRYKLPGAQLGATLAYSLYLTHKEMIHLVDRALPQLQQAGPYAWLAAYASCCLALAGALYLCIERPFLRLRDRLHAPITAIGDRSSTTVQTT